MFQTGESGTIKERGECQCSVCISHSSCLYFIWEGWRTDVVQGNADKQERQYGFSANDRQSYYFGWPDMLTEEVPMKMFCWLCGELHWALGIVSQGRSLTSRPVLYQTSISSVLLHLCLCAALAEPYQGGIPAPSSPCARCTLSTHCRGCSCLALSRSKVKDTMQICKRQTRPLSAVQLLELWPWKQSNIKEVLWKTEGKLRKSSNRQDLGKWSCYPPLTQHSGFIWAASLSAIRRNIRRSSMENPSVG